MYCLVCGKSINDEQSENNHNASIEHHNNMKEYSAYQAIENKYSRIFEDANSVINSASIVHMSIRAQVEKIKECKRKFDREKKGQIEDNFAWSNGQNLIEHYAKEIDLLLKEYYELLQIIELKDVN